MRIPGLDLLGALGVRAVAGVGALIRGREVRGGPLLGLAQGLGRRSQAGVNLEVAQSAFAKYCILYMARRMVYHA